MNYCPDGYDIDEWHDALDEARAKVQSTACRCGGDMPGTCPGPSSCPMCETPDEEGEDE